MALTIKLKSRRNTEVKVRAQCLSCDCKCLIRDESEGEEFIPIEELADNENISTLGTVLLPACPKEKQEAA